MFSMQDDGIVGASGEANKSFDNKSMQSSQSEKPHWSLIDGYSKQHEYVRQRKLSVPLKVGLELGKQSESSQDAHP